MIPLLAALLVTVIIGAGALRRVDRWMQDWLFQRPGVPSREIVIIGIDETAFDFFGPYNTWDRNIMASALEALTADPENLPAAVALDVLYAGNTSEQADERLARAAEALGCVVDGRHDGVRRARHLGERPGDQSGSRRGARLRVALRGASALRHPGAHQRHGRF